jgi:hypothetical protein
MIQLFRKIRQKLLQEGKVINYLKYAIGEILLVVIGILIALQVNNWNENRKTYIKELALLTGLKQELTANLQELNRIIEVNQKRNDGAHKLVSVLSPKKTTLSDVEISQLWYNALAREAVYKPSLGVLNEAISTGSLSIIKNIALRDFFASIESDLQLLKTQEEGVYLFRLECLKTTRELGNVRIALFDAMETEIAEKLGISSFENSNKELLQSKKFENDLVFFIGTTNLLQTAFLLPLKDKMTEAMKILNTELNHD